MVHFLALLCLSLLSCVAMAASTLNVAVAANVQYAFDDLARSFTAETGIALKPSYGASGKFAAQITHGAPFHVFLSADMKYPQALVQDGLALGPVMPYAYGSLVLWTLQPLNLTDWPALLGSAAVRKIALPHPDTAPYGRAALEAMTTAGVPAAARAKLVYGESVAQANQFIRTGAAEVGFTAKSVVLAPEQHGRGRWLELPANSYAPIAQGAVVLKAAQGEEATAARRFLSFLGSAKARAILQAQGYRLP